MASKSYGWDVRNIAKISPKMAKKQPFFDFFRFSQKLSIRFERNFLQLFYSILESYMCNGIKIVWLGCEKHSQNCPKIGQKQSFFDFFFDFLKNCPYDSNEIFYSHSTPYYGPLCAISSSSYGWDVRNIVKFSPKMAKKPHFSIFSIFSQTVHTIRTKASQKEKDLSRLLYCICGSSFFCFVVLDFSVVLFLFQCSVFFKFIGF